MAFEVQAETRIGIDCLNCGHCGSLSERQLARFGLAPDASLVVLTRRLTCRACGGKAVRAFRYVEDEDRRWCPSNNLGNHQRVPERTSGRPGR